MDPSARGASEALFKRVAEAYETLSDAEKRTSYDATLQGVHAWPEAAVSREDDVAYPDDVRPPELVPSTPWWEHAAVVPACVALGVLCCALWTWQITEAVYIQKICRTTLLRNEGPGITPVRLLLGR